MTGSYISPADRPYDGLLHRAPTAPLPGERVWHYRFSSRAGPVPFFGYPPAVRPPTWIGIAVTVPIEPSRVWTLADTFKYRRPSRIGMTVTR